MCCSCASVLTSQALASPLWVRSYRQVSVQQRVVTQPQWCGGGARTTSSSTPETAAAPGTALLAAAWQPHPVPTLCGMGVQQPGVIILLQLKLYYP